MEAPDWLQSLVALKADVDLRFIMQKEMTASDVRADQHRLLIPKTYAEDRLFPSLNAEERPRIFPSPALLPNGRLVSKRHGPGEGQAAAAVDALTVLPGVSVQVYQRSGWMFHAQLKYWPSTGHVVLNGGEYGRLMSWNNTLEVGDLVQLWAFRSAGHLRLVIFKA